MTTSKATPYGTAWIGEDGRVTISAAGHQLRAWATRPGYSWPCSELSDLEWIRAEFLPNGDLIDLDHLPPHAEDEEYGVNLTADEFNAWAEDVMEATR